jgi:nucleoside phosphorylase
MNQKIIFIVMILLGGALLVAAITFWFDTLTSSVSIGLGQHIRDWLATILDMVTWIAAYKVKKSIDSKSIEIINLGRSSQIATGENPRNIQTNGEDYIKKIEINIPSTEDAKGNNLAIQQEDSLQPGLNQLPEFQGLPSKVSSLLGGLLIVTVTKVEAQAVLDTFSIKRKWDRMVLGIKTYYRLGMHGEVPIFMVQSEMGTATPSGSLLTVRQAIQDLQPQAVIMCGICFGLQPRQQSLGDILISKQIQYYEPQKVDLKKGNIPRGDRTMASERLLDHFHSGDIEWNGAKTHFGLILSGEKVVNDPDFRKKLMEIEPEAIGGEMEGAGLYAAARETKVDWILVKSICDWADGTKNSSAQSLAARNAAQFVLHIIQLGGWSQPQKDKYKYTFRNKHEFQSPQYSYKPIQDTITELEKKLEELDGGYIGVFGPPGSGKSTFLTQTLRTLPVRLIRYYAYVPDAQDPSVLRGESVNFFHDVTLRMQQLGIGGQERPDPTNRIALIELFDQQLSLLGKDYESTKTRTIILIDGLDHIAREQHPERSLIADLPIPRSIPIGVYIIIGSQTKELPNLPVSILQAFSRPERTINMGKLSPENVFEIIHQTLPDIDEKLYKKIYMTVDGHPLALIYLINSLSQAKTPNDYSNILESSITYQGNIEEQYFSHWKKIENDLEFANFLGLLARIRGPIPINWVAKWANQASLIKLKGVFGQYFSNDSLDRWEFFHNSFRIFLEAKTAEALPGLSSEQIDQNYHLQLAKLYEDYGDQEKWEVLYHYYKSGEYKRVTTIAQYDWFRLQVEALRPIDAIETDVRLAIKSAGELLDTIALIRYTLIGASLQQRSNVLKDSHLPHLLIDAGKNELAIDYARDGARLRLEDEAALSFCKYLYDAGIKKEATRIFELAEPLEYLSGRPIKGDHTPPQNLHDLLSEWVESASLIRTPTETSKIIRRIQAEPSLSDKNKNIAVVSLGLQNWLLQKGALACCDREDYDGWQIYFDSLDEGRDHEARYFTLLHTIEHLRKNNQIDRAKELLLKLLALEDLKSFGNGRNNIANLLALIEAVYFLKIENFEEIAKKWLDRIPIIPLSDHEIVRDNTPKLFNLQFRFARIKYLFEPALTADQLIKESESNTTFGEYDDSDTRLARCQLAFIAFNLAKLWVYGYLGGTQNPELFLSNTKWIFDLVESGWSSQPASVHLEVDGMKTEISKCLVVCAAIQGQDTLISVQKEYFSRWGNNPDSWWPGIQREIVLALHEEGSDRNWTKNNLDRIETTMLRGLDIYSRVEECEKQAKAWLRIDEKENALSSLKKLMKSARGVYSDKDYQLSQWAIWLRRINNLEPTTSYERIQTFANQILNLEEIASGVGDALLVVIQAIFDSSPDKAIQVYKMLLERKSITYEDGMVKLLDVALDPDTPPIQNIFWIIEDLLLPFARSSTPELLHKFILRTKSVLGAQVTTEISRHLVQRIKINAIPNHRGGWLEGVYDGLKEIGIDPATIDIRQTDLEREIRSSNENLNQNLHLSTGEVLTMHDALSTISTVEILRFYLEREDRQKNNYFEWHKLAINIISKASTSQKVSEICNLMEQRIDQPSKDSYLVKVYASASTKLSQLGKNEDAKLLIRKALALTRPSGWITYYDDGAKQDVMRLMLHSGGAEARNELIMLYVQDISERFRYPEEMIRNLDEIVQILFDKTPYSSIWPDIEKYLEELFAGTVIETAPELESILKSPIETISDNAENALSKLLLLYLDFPAYPISNKAIKICAKALLVGDTSVVNALQLSLLSYDQLAKEALTVLEIVSYQKPTELSIFQDQIVKLQKSPNFEIRIIATKIINNILGQASNPPIVSQSIPAIYTIQLPDISIHKTEDLTKGDSEPILLGDPALLLRPFDIEARNIAEIAKLPEANILYHAAEIVKALETQRTWLSNGQALPARSLMNFLEKNNLYLSHNLPKISPAKNAVAHVAAELYDAGQLSVSDLPILEFIFRDYDPNLYLTDSYQRPKFVMPMGGLDSRQSAYGSFPKDWTDTLESSVPLLKERSTDGRIILAEWTHLKQLEDEWPTEERFSLLRAASPQIFWDDIDPYEKELPFAAKIGVSTLDYPKRVKFPEKELVVAHNGYRYRMEEANWIGLNPRVGVYMGWHLSDDGWFRWKNSKDQVVVETIFWQDGNFDSFCRYDHVEVGYGWVVLITEEAYQDLRKGLGAISRGVVIKRDLGWLGSIASKKFVSHLNAV